MQDYVKFLNISKSYKKEVVLKDINFSVKKGEFIVVLGPSGSGKSTMLELICGFERPSSGSISIDGQVIDDIEVKDRNISMIFQNYALMPHMNVYDNIALGMKIRKEKKSNIKQKVLWAAKILDIEDKLYQKPAELSGGQRQRVAIARGIVREPKLFLMDEPLSNLDYKLRVSSAKEIASLNKSINGTTIYVTHDQEEALTMADRIIILEKGSIAQIGTPREIYEKPSNIFVAEFIGRPKINLLDVCIDDNYIKIGNYKIEKIKTLHNIKDEYILGFRAEDIIINEKGVLSGSIEKIDYAAGENIITIKIGNHIILAKTYNRVKFNINETIKFDIDINKINLFDKKTGRNTGGN